VINHDHSWLYTSERSTNDKGFELGSAIGDWRAIRDVVAFECALSVLICDVVVPFVEDRTMKIKKPVIRW
jgi:hypothetical protein